LSLSNNLIVTYSRVSSSDQKHDLLRQSSKLNDFAISFKAKHSTKLDILNISDLGSGLNYKKKGLNQLILLIISRKIHTLIINHKDRLLRFGSDIIFNLCQYFNVNVIILEQKLEQSFEMELSSDVIELMTVFCAKLYGKRSHSNKKIVA
jgi:hypothetical protein